MVIIMKEDCQKREIGEVLAAIRKRELKPRIIVLTDIAPNNIDG